MTLQSDFIKFEVRIGQIGPDQIEANTSYHDNVRGFRLTTGLPVANA